MTEMTAIRRHLDSLLGGVASGGYHDEIAPIGTLAPYVVSVELGLDDVMNGMARAGATESVRRVYAVSATGKMPGDEADAIHAALEQTTTTQGPYEVFSHRLRPYGFADVSDGRQFRQQGGDYQIVVRDLS